MTFHPEPDHYDEILERAFKDLTEYHQKDLRFVGHTCHATTKDQKAINKVIDKHLQGFEYDLRAHFLSIQMKLHGIKDNKRPKADNYEIANDVSNTCHKFSSVMNADFNALVDELDKKFRCLSKKDLYDVRLEVPTLASCRGVTMAMSIFKDIYMPNVRKLVKSLKEQLESKEKIVRSHNPVVVPVELQTL